jgi:hypothetical protein
MAGQPADVEAIMPRDPDYDLFDPAHVARLVVYLVSPLCRFTGRAFGVRADDIFLHGSWNALHHVGNGGKAWTSEALAGALEALPLQEEVQIVAPAGGIDVRAPADPVLEALDAAR